MRLQQEMSQRMSHAVIKLCMVVDISVRGCKMTLRVWQLARPALLSIAQDTIT